MGVVTLLALAASIMGALAYMPSGNDHLLTDSLLREVVDRMGHDLAESYLDYPSNGRLSMGALMSRADKDLDDAPFYPDSPSPSLRDPEYIQHSTLWGHHYLTGGNGEGKHRINLGLNGGSVKAKSDATLPAYCNPPNPCPIGFSDEDGCLEQYENTAAFSRDYQAAQDCMCDSEHMFDCERKNRNNVIEDSELGDYDMSIDNQHKNLVAKKFHVKKDSNPFFQGEKLPIAAKKGINVEY